MTGDSNGCQLYPLPAASSLGAGSALMKFLVAHAGDEGPAIHLRLAILLAPGGIGVKKLLPGNLGIGPHHTTVLDELGLGRKSNLCWKKTKQHGCYT